ncbi:MAG: ECF transporter S component [Candidatus Altiarchaeales archaeon]|nr:ECF transporter S component [Candidatus Altiarchaeales archaeon]
MIEVLTLNWMAFTFTLAIAVALLFTLKFEHTANPKSIALLGMLTALVVVSRQLFHSVGEFSPVFFLVMVIGVVYGSLSGFMVGASTMLVSNFLLGHGPWTPYQMLALGLVGFFAGLMQTRNTIILTVYSIFAAYFYGFVTDLFWWSAFAAEHSLQTYIAVASAGLLMDSSRALGNVLFTLVLSKPLIKILQRFRNRFHYTVLKK